MKRFITACTLSLAVCTSAFAEPVEVMIPGDLTSDITAAAYTDALIDAVEEVCRDEASPIIGLGYSAYQACRKATLHKIALTEPTGLLAARLGLSTPLKIAAK